MQCEIGVLGCILLSPKECANECISLFGICGKEIFYDLRHQTIFEEIVAMVNDCIEIDVITLQERLKGRNLLEQVGGLAYLSSLADAVPSAANLSYYTDFLKEKYLLRKTIVTCTDVVGRIYDFEGEVDELMDEIEHDIFQIQNFRLKKKSPSTLETVKEANATIEDYSTRKGALIGLSTGLSDLDKKTGGLIGGDMIVIAARPSIGKTSLALNIAEHLSVDCKIPVGVHSLEMTRKSLIMRMICSRAGVNIRDIIDGVIKDNDWTKIRDASGKIGSAPLYIEDQSGISIMQFRAQARRMVQQYGVRLFVIDYIQMLIATRGKERIANRREEMEQISSGIKALAKELDVPIIVLSQLNRELEKGKPRKPRVSDLKESGSLEQDADVIGLLYKTASTEDEEPAQVEQATAVTLDIAKQRNGPTGEVYLRFFKNLTRFRGVLKVEDRDVPGDRDLF